MNGGGRALHGTEQAEYMNQEVGAVVPEKGLLDADFCPLTVQKIFCPAY